MRRTLIPVSLAAVIALAAWTMAARAADKNRDWPAYGGDKAQHEVLAARPDQQGHDQEPEDRVAPVRACPRSCEASFPDAQAPANYQHTPLMVDGLLYMSTAVGAVVALDPATGKTLWFDTLPPRPDGQGPRAAARRAASPTGPTATTRASSPTSAPTSSR